jgi:hypothetical protein
MGKFGYPVYGKRSGPTNLERVMPVGASEVFKKAGGAFVIDDGSGRAEVAGASDTNIIGYAMIEADHTASSTEGADKVKVDTSLESVFEIPVDSGSTWADTMVGKACDLSVASSTQYANLSASSVKPIIIVGKGYENAAGTVKAVRVRLNPSTLARSGV